MKNSFEATNGTYKTYDIENDNDGAGITRSGSSPEMRKPRSTGALERLSMLSMSPKQQERREKRRARKADTSPTISPTRVSHPSPTRSKSPIRISTGFGMKTTLSSGSLHGVSKAAKQVATSMKHGATAMMNKVHFPRHQSSTSDKRSSKRFKRSKWEESLQIIDELLDANDEHSLYHSMTAKQRKQLVTVKKLLLELPQQGVSSSATSSRPNLAQLEHIPRGLARQTNKTSSRHLNKNISNDNKHEDSKRFILQEYAGIQDTEDMAVRIDERTLSFSSDDENDDDDDDDEDSFGTPSLADLAAMEEEEKEAAPRTTSRVRDTSTATTGENTSDPEPTANTGSFACSSYVPPEFTSLSQEAQQQLIDMLSWESIQQWDFNVFELNKITNSHPLLFLGWAILASKQAHQAMRDKLQLEPSPDLVPPGYGFVEEFHIPMDKLCNYMRVIESDYSTKNAYHNAIHAADVLQTLHAMMQQAHDQVFMKHCSKLQKFSILLSAVVHDVDHNGKTNAFHVQVKSELAVLYNDKSVLENWHIAHAFARLLNVDLRQQYLAVSVAAATSQITSNTNSTPTVGFGADESPNNFLCNTTMEQFIAIRKLMIEAVLSTDMSHHFQKVNAARGLLVKYMEEDQDEEQSWKVLEYMMHLADISSQAKAAPLFHQWTDRCLEEFFDQGDEEAARGLPISLLCDRKTTGVPESQIGFIQFVVEPAFEVLGSFIPFVRDTVMTIIHSNLDHWQQEVEQKNAKARLGGEEE